MPSKTSGLKPGGVGAGRALVALLLLGVAVEFLLGIDVNLYSTCLPAGVNTLFAGNRCASGQSMLEAHVLVGVVIGLLAVALLAWSLRHRIPGLTGPAFGGLLGIVIAAAGGYEFLAPSGTAADALLMALGFLIAFGAYFGAASALRDYSRTGGAAIRWTPPPSSSSP